MLDIGLAIGHHFLVFAIAAIIAFELGIVRPDMDARDVAKVVGVDLWYGIVAAAILVVGFSRAIFAAKGWDYYSHDLFFWTKIAIFVVVVSVRPTMAILRWRKATRADPAATPPTAEIAQVRQALWLEVALFALLPICAAAMARGYGGWG